MYDRKSEKARNMSVNKISNTAHTKHKNPGHSSGRLGPGTISRGAQLPRRLYKTNYLYDDRESCLCGNMIYTFFPVAWERDILSLMREARLRIHGISHLFISGPRICYGLASTLCCHNVPTP